MEEIKARGLFVILKHEDNVGVHFDLILEGYNLCPTFKSETAKFDVFERINDHRMIYLEFEGDIGESRGLVTRVNQGEFNFDGKILDLNNGIKIQILPF